jgi:hypothetical protein
MWVVAGKVHLALRAAQAAYEAAPHDASCSGLLLMVQQGANMGVAAEQEQQQGDSDDDGGGQRLVAGESEEDSEREEGRQQRQLGQEEGESGEEEGRREERAAGVGAAPPAPCRARLPRCSCSAVGERRGCSSGAAWPARACAGR